MTTTEPKTPAKKATAHKTLGEALGAFQADLPEINMDATNPHFKSKYASLANITKKVLPALSANGLAFSVGSRVEDGLLVLDAHLIHAASGESRSAQFPITETNPQKVGSAISYYRRYALSSLTGIVADEDDDGNAASAPAPRAVQQAQAATAVKAPAAKKTGADAVRAEIKEKYLDTGKITLDELNERVAQVQQETVNHKKDEKLYKDVLASLDADK